METKADRKNAERLRRILNYEIDTDCNSTYTYAGSKRKEKKRKIKTDNSRNGDLSPSCKVGNLAPDEGKPIAGSRALWENGSGRAMLESA